MSLFGQLFSKNKELKGEQIASLLNTLSVHREPVIVRTSSFKFVTDILAYDQRVFHLKNTVSREEVLYQLKGKKLHVMIPYELTIYGGESRLLGLGMVSGIHTLKLQAPGLLSQEESRGAYRVSKFVEKPVVTFTTDNFDIIKARLSDISMTGAGIRLDSRWERGNTKLAPRTSIIIDIKLTENIRISTTATVRYASGYKCGVQFEELGKPIKDKLFKFVVEKRREEQRALIQVQNVTAAKTPEEAIAAPPPEAVEQPKGKPTALIIGEHQKYCDFLTTALTRQFDLLYSTTSITDIRNHLDLHPNLCLIDLKEENQEQVAQMRKASTLLPPGCVLMFYGRSFSDAFRNRFENYGYPSDILITMKEAKKLLVFKQIQAYYKLRAPS